MKTNFLYKEIRNKKDHIKSIAKWKKATSKHFIYTQKPIKHSHVFIMSFLFFFVVISLEKILQTDCITIVLFIHNNKKKPNKAKDLK